MMLRHGPSAFCPIVSVGKNAGALLLITVWLYPDSGRSFDVHSERVYLFRHVLYIAVEAQTCCVIKEIRCNPVSLPAGATLYYLPFFSRWEFLLLPTATREAARYY